MDLETVTRKKRKLIAVLPNDGDADAFESSCVFMRYLTGWNVFIK